MGDSMRSAILNEKTTIPLWGVLMAVPVFCAGVLAFGLTTWQTYANSETLDRYRGELEKLQTSDKEQDKKFIELAGDMRADIAVIKTILEERKKEGK